MLRRLEQAVQRSLRYKLLLLVLFPILLALPVALGLVVYWNREFSATQMYHKVNTDLAVARDVFARLQRDYLNRLAYLGDSYAFRTSYAERNEAELHHQLGVLVKTTEFGFLHITDLEGRRLLIDGATPDAVRNTSPLHRDAASGKPGVGIQVFSNPDLAAQDAALAAGAAMDLIETPRARPDPRDREARALVIRAVFPIRSLSGEIVALLDGGVVLNRNLDVVDRIKDLVYGPGSLAEDSIGTVAVTIDDVRISTNVPLRGGERAVGTRVSEDVRRDVLDRGNTWVDRAFVVNDWYISAYEPITDVYGERVGMLYVGFLEKPYRNAYHAAIALLCMFLLLGLGIAATLAVRGARAIFQPIEAMASVVRATQAGRQSRIGPIASQDEIGELARQLDEMLNRLERREEQLRQSAEKLEATVQERTRELTGKNEHLCNTIELLTQTERQLVMAEKFAALGELTAGVAHEINNPTAVILGNIELIRSELGDDLSSVNTEVDLIIDQVSRIRNIVDHLLQYARPTDFAGPTEDVDVGSVVEQSLVLVRHELESKGIAVQKNFANTATVAIDRRELQQVIVNLLVNAVHALPDGGNIKLSTRDWDDLGVVLRVEDNGKGIPSSQLGRVFDPFFTTDRQGGTGLGLSVSYSLVRRYGGDISVSSREGEGTSFQLFLRRMPLPESEATPAEFPRSGTKDRLAS